MAKKSKKPLDLLRDKKDQLDWHKFNFLENMLVFCVLPEKSVPRESGVHFRVTPRSTADSICLLFKIDRRTDSLFEDHEIKPDYLTIFLKDNIWLFTIIEMKGTTEKRIKHGVDQITALKTKLRDEFRDNFPNKFPRKFQAIILSPTGTQTPDRYIAEQSKASGIVIKPLQYHHKAELFDYVSQELTLITPKYKHQEIKSGDKPLLAEYVLANGALPIRIDDKFKTTHKDRATNQKGIYVNYAFPNGDSYAALTMDETGMTLGVRENGDCLKCELYTNLKSVGLESPRHFRVEEID